LSDATRDFVDDDVVVRRVAAQQATQADNRIVSLGYGQRTGGGGNFEGAGNTNDLDVFAFCAATQKSVERASKQPFGDELVKP
jgi:hypothetical protein